MLDVIAEIKKEEMVGKVNNNKKQQKQKNTYNFKKSYNQLRRGYEWTLFIIPKTGETTMVLFNLCIWL